MIRILFCTFQVDITEYFQTIRRQKEQFIVRDPITKKCACNIFPFITGERLYCTSQAQHST